MTPSRLSRFLGDPRLAGFVGFGLLAPLAFLGLRDGIDEWGTGLSAVQRLTKVIEVAYGLLAALSVLAVVARRSALARPLLVPCAVAATVSGTVAPVVWGGADWVAGAVAGVASALICALIVWLCRRYLRAANLTTVPSTH
jgi:hypothetical protein